MADNMERDDLMEIVTLEDEAGNAVEFELADQIAYGGKEYVVLMPLDEDDTGIVILEYEETGEEEGDLFTDVEDDDILQAVFGIFKEKYQDILTFEE